MELKLHYNWTLKDAIFTKDKGKVFSCFSCGGGSTMGYKLAGFDVIGCNEIDKKMFDVYCINHNPKFAYNEDIRIFKDRTDLPNELYNLDILDGSPPCSSFSMAGNREADWGKEKKFREGQANQVLDTLFFDFIELGKKLQPKVIIAENVKGLLLGNAKQYVRKIYGAFEDAGYYCQHFLLDASKMGVPQRRERVFFIALRKDLAEPFLYNKSMFEVVPEIQMNFSENEIPFKEIADDTPKELRRTCFNDELLELWKNTKPGNCFSTAHEKGSYFNTYKIEPAYTLPTLHTDCYRMNYLPDIPYCMSSKEILKAATFPQDYNFNCELEKENGNKFVGYLCGMSVPPLMTARISNEIYKQWLSKI